MDKESLLLEGEIDRLEMQNCEAHHNIEKLEKIIKDLQIMILNDKIDVLKQLIEKGNKDG